MISDSSHGKREKDQNTMLITKSSLAALIKYREDVEIAEIQGKVKPVIPRYIGECFLKIANHLIFQTKLCELHVQGGHDL